MRHGGHRRAREMTTRVEAGAYEQLAGRWLALCLHPITGWRVTSNTERALILVAYFTLGYLAGLFFMLLLTR
jgi:hypothetical protein